MKSAQKTKPFTLITGASAGLGRALAIECAKQDRSLILVALPETGLSDLARDIRKKFRVQAIPIETDLCQDEALHDTAMSVSRQYHINCLINNVGMGCTFCFHEISEKFIQQIIDLNIRTTSVMTYYLLPNLMKNKQAHIINISSLLSQYPVAYKTVYPASKAFIYSFSLGLREELKNSPVKVSVALPGGMLTNKDVSLRMHRQNWLAQAAILGAEEVAQTILDQAFKGKKVIIPGLINKFFWGLMKVIPCRFGIPLLSDIYRKEIRNPEERADTLPATESNQDPDLIIGKKSPIGFLHPSDRSYHPLSREPAVEEHHETV